MAAVKQKYFIAIIPPEPFKSKLFAIKEDISREYKTKGALRSPAHITLHMPFEFNENKEEVIVNFLNKFVESCRPFEILLNGFNCFEPKVIYVDVMKSKELNELYQLLILQIKPSLQLFNADYKGYGFSPHLTVAFRDLKKPMFYLAWDKYKNEELKYSFICNKIVLLKHNGKTWDEYREFVFKIN